MPVVSNTTPVLYLAKIKRLPILRDTYREVFVSAPVWRELLSPLLYGKPIPSDVPIIVNAGEEGWLKTRNTDSEDALSMQEKLVAEGLGVGEASSLALAYEVGAILLANDEAAMSTARRYKIKTRWFTEVLHDALVKNIIRTSEDYEEVLNLAIEEGLYVSKKERKKAVDLAYELAKRK